MSNTTTLPAPRYMALHLAKLGLALSGPSKVEREHLCAIVEALDEAFDTQSAHQEALHGVSKLPRPCPQGDRPAVWLLCAVAALLGGGERPGPLVLAPPDADLAQWGGLIDSMVNELASDAVMHRTDVDRLQRRLLLTSLRIWLSSVQLIQLRAKAGDAVPNDPDALPVPGVNTTAH